MLEQSTAAKGFVDPRSPGPTRTPVLEAQQQAPAQQQAVANIFDPRSPGPERTPVTGNSGGADQWSAAFGAGSSGGDVFGQPSDQVGDSGLMSPGVNNPFAPVFGAPLDAPLQPVCVPCVLRVDEA